MNNRYLVPIALLFFSFIVNAQSYHTIFGRVVNEHGEGIEYVSIGIPKDSVFTVSDIDGYFSLKIPEGKNEDIRFFHVSYESVSLPPGRYYSAKDSLFISMVYIALPEVVVVPRKEKSTTILGKGVRWAGASFGLSNSYGGIKDEEWGSLVSIRKPTRVDKAELEAKLDEADRAVLSFVIYKVDKENKSYVPVQHMPVYQSLTIDDGWKKLVFNEPETLILEPGKYYFAVRFVEFVGKGALVCKGYFKNAYDRGDDFKMPLSLGLRVIGTEYYD